MMMSEDDGEGSILWYFSSQFVANITDMEFAAADLSGENIKLQRGLS